MPLSLYLHFPFCQHDCSYCDFYKEIYQEELEEKFFRALTVETELAAKELAGRRKISTVFVGGGTPSLANVDRLAEWMDLLDKFFDVPEGIEFSMEMNPESVTLENLGRLKELGLNRPVFGVQSFNPKFLSLLGRKHSPHDCQQAAYFAGVLGMNNFGVDLVFGLPGQTGSMLEYDIQELQAIGPSHVSFYSLTVEPGTLLDRQVATGEVTMLEPEFQSALYRAGCEQLAHQGYHRYELSSFAQSGFECLHNRNYWNGHEYLGLGPSAHSLIDGHRYYNRRGLSDYVNLLSKQTLPREEDKSGEDERITEAVMMSLRTETGINREQFAGRFNKPVDARLDRKQYELLIKSGHLIEEKDSLRLSPEAMAMADEITQRLLK